MAGIARTASVLLVDDQRDVRQMLRAALESLARPLRVVEVPSGEEALLVSRLMEIDLLVADIRLAGMSGFDLVLNMQNGFPDLKIILITGMRDEETRQRVAQAKVEAYFFKPVVIDDFLQAVQTVLGPVDSLEQVKTEPQPVPVPGLPAEEPAQEAVGLLEFLNEVCRRLEAISVALLDEQGRILARAGVAPDSAQEARLIPVLLTILSAGAKAAYFLERFQPDDLYSISGVDSNVHLAHVTEQLALLVITPGNEHTGASREPLDKKIRPVVAELMNLLPRLTLPPPDAGQAGPVGPLPGSQDGRAPELESYLQQSAEVKLDPVEIDDFWEAAAAETGQESTRSGALTFEEARRLGLASIDPTPQEDE